MRTIICIGMDGGVASSAVRAGIERLGGRAVSQGNLADFIVVAPNRPAVPIPPHSARLDQALQRPPSNHGPAQVSVPDLLQLALCSRPQPVSGPAHIILVTADVAIPFNLITPIMEAHVNCKLHVIDIQRNAPSTSNEAEPMNLGNIYHYSGFRETAPVLQDVFQNIFNRHYRVVHATLRAGHLSEPVRYFPYCITAVSLASAASGLQVSYPTTISILGFLLETEPSIRILPHMYSVLLNEETSGSSGLVNALLANLDAQYALDKLNRVAFVQLDPNWYGFLVLSTRYDDLAVLKLIVLHPGENAIPWISSLQTITLTQSGQKSLLVPLRKGWRDLLNESASAMLANCSQLDDPVKEKNFRDQLANFQKISVEYGVYQETRTVLADELDQKNQAPNELLTKTIAQLRSTEHRWN